MFINSLEQCNRAIDNEFRKYKSKLDIKLHCNQITYEEWIFINKSLINKQSLLKIRAIQLFLNGSQEIEFNEFNQMKMLR